MKRVKLKKSSPPPYWRRAKYGVVDTANNHADWLIRNGHAVLIKDLGKVFAPLKFGARVRWIDLDWRVINVYNVEEDDEQFDVADILIESAFGKRPLDYDTVIFSVRVSELKKIY